MKTARKPNRFDAENRSDSENRLDPETKSESGTRFDTGTGIIGLGRVGNSLASNLARISIPVRAVWDSNPEAIARFLQTFGSRFASGEIADLRLCGAVLIAVHDSQIDGVLDNLISNRLLSPGTLVIHTSGTHLWGSDRGHETLELIFGSIHPMMAFPSNPSHVRDFNNIGFSVDGDPEALNDIFNLIERWGGRAFRIPGDKRTLSHVSAVFSSNFPVLMQGIARDILTSIGLETESAQFMLNGLLDSIRYNLSLETPRQAISGPVVRKDETTIARHIEELESCFPQYADLYRQLTAALREFLNRHD